MNIKPLQRTRHASLSRRLLIGSAAALALPAVWRAAVAQGSQRLTPSQTEGPFYPVTLPADSDADLLTQGDRRYTQGQAVWLEGTVTDPAGRALRGASVEIWQCDVQGHYHYPGHGNGADPLFQGFGRSAVNAQGEYRFHTIRPVRYAGRTPHIHVKVKLDRRELLTTQLYVEGEAENQRDGVWRQLSAIDRAAVTVPFQPGPDGLRARFALVVAA